MHQIKSVSVPIFNQAQGKGVVKALPHVSELRIALQCLALMDIATTKTKSYGEEQKQ